MTGDSKVLSASRMATEVWVKAPRVDDDAAGAVPRLVDPVDDLVFAVALVEADSAELQSVASVRQSASTSARVSWP